MKVSTTGAVSLVPLALQWASITEQLPNPGINKAVAQQSQITTKQSVLLRYLCGNLIP